MIHFLNQFYSTLYFKQKQLLSFQLNSIIQTWTILTNSTTLNAKHTFKFNLETYKFHTIFIQKKELKFI